MPNILEARDVLAGAAPGETSMRRPAHEGAGARVEHRPRPRLADGQIAERGRVAHAGSDQFFYWVPGDTKKCRAPDVYVVDGVPQATEPVGTWKVWQGHFPSLAIEVCGSEWEKDYDEAPADYDTMGCQELIVFDPWGDQGKPTARALAGLSPQPRGGPGSGAEIQRRSGAFAMARMLPPRDP